MEESPYSILGISKHSSIDEVRKAYKKLAIKYHPDKNNNDDTMFKKINNAYEQIVNPKDNNQDINNFNMENMNFFNSFFNFSSSSTDMEFDLINVDINIHDIYFGNSKKVEFELVDKCDKCDGKGYENESDIVRCYKCEGKKSFTRQMGPFIHSFPCDCCMGVGMIIKRKCQKCKGEQVIYRKKVFELKIPKGISDNYEIKLNNKGSYNLNKNIYRTIIFKLKYNIQEPHILLNNKNIVYNCKLNIIDLLCGFNKEIKIYYCEKRNLSEIITISSNGYFNPNKKILIKEKGLYDIKKNIYNDLYIKFDIEFEENNTLYDANILMKKIFKKNDDNNNESMYNIQKINMNK